jgi:hypothetical protein
MIDHDYWRGNTYSQGIGGQKLAVVGYSHYREQHEVDYDDFTKDTIKEVLSGKNIGFFRSIAGYFGRKTDFWEDAIFFNFIPDCIGTSDQKFLWGTKEQNRRGKERLLRIIGLEKPDILIAFTTKGWRSFPSTEEEKPTSAIGNTIPLGASFSREFRWGTYRVDGHTVIAAGLRHPQGAHSDAMGRAVREILKLSNR